jgi:hypothetical protein
MRRIDVFGIGIGVFLAGGGLFLAFRVLGLDGISAGRVVTHNMTLNQQMDDYETAVLQKRLEELSPEELEALQAKLEQDQTSSGIPPTP